MKVFLASMPPAPDKNTLFALFLSTEGKDSVTGRWDLDDSHSAEKGKKHFWTRQESVGIAIGMGDAPSLEDYRRAVHQAVGQANEFGCSSLVLDGHGFDNAERILAISETILLSSYQFLPYKSEADKQQHSLKEVQLCASGEEAQSAMESGLKIAQNTCLARDLVNEPLVTLTAEELSSRIEKLGEEKGFSVEVFHKPRIQALKMGGLLAVNRGSLDPPTFSILEYKPENATNEKPIILVGKGVVFDTGGLSLKPTANSMDFMKADMGGAAAVVGAVCGVTDLKLDKWVIGLIPATDNRPGQNAYVPGDVITMFDGSTVEVLNTDAEGRMILADALAYAKQYDPELVIDLATLTGAAVVAVGSPGLAMMSTADEKQKTALKDAGQAVYERLVELPLWDEYGEMLRSDIADQKNIGGREAGAITAGKFLEHFTDYPWIHLDVAGSAWLFSPDHYRGKNGTGVGVRLLIHFIKHYE